MKRKSLLTIAVVAVLGIGAVVGYQTMAFSGEGCSASKASADKAAACCASKASADKAAGCCASKTGAAQASATLGDATVIPVGGAGCSASKAGAKQASSGCTHAQSASAGCSAKDAAACGGCELYKAHWASLEKAEFSMKTVDDGIVITFASNDPEVLADLLVYANAKAKMYSEMANSDKAPAGCEFCRDKAQLMQKATFEVKSSDHDVVTIVTAKDKDTIVALQKLATAQAEG